MINNSNFIGSNQINYYSTRLSCISSSEKKSWCEKAASFITSFGTLFTYALHRGVMVVNKSGQQIDQYIKAPKKNSKRLIVCLHGLNRNPAQFKQIVDEITKKDDSSKSDIYIPNILKRGYANLDKMAQAVLRDIAVWAKMEGEKELVLVGISNGSRIARAIETVDQTQY